MSQRRHSEVATVSQVLRGGVNAPPAKTVAILMWTHCVCGANLAAVARRDEIEGDVLDAVLRAAGWDPAHDLCPVCRAEEHDLAAVDGRDAEGCPTCGRRC